MSEVCPLKELPTVEYVYVCGEKDDAIRPEWEQWAAREYLHVEPVVVKGAGHANIVLYAKEVVDAATKGLWRIGIQEDSSLKGGRMADDAPVNHLMATQGSFAQSGPLGFA